MRSGCGRRARRVSQASQTTDEEVVRRVFIVSGELQAEYLKCGGDVTNQKQDFETREEEVTRSLDYR
jgi:hypothetical protein